MEPILGPKRVPKTALERQSWHQEGPKKAQRSIKATKEAMCKKHEKHLVFEQFWVLGGVVLQPLGAFLGPKMQPGGDKKRNQKRDPQINKKTCQNGSKKHKKGTPEKVPKRGL